MEVRIRDDVAVIGKRRDAGKGQRLGVIGDRERRADRVGGAVEQPRHDVAAVRVGEGRVFVDHQSLVAGGRHRWIALKVAVAFNCQRSRSGKLCGGAGGIDHVQVNVVVGRAIRALEHHDLAPGREVAMSDSSASQSRSRR